MLHVLILLFFRFSEYVVSTRCGNHILADQLNQPILHEVKEPHALNTSMLNSGTWSSKAPRYVVIYPCRPFLSMRDFE
jgi:hypothetical protein